MAIWVKDHAARWCWEGVVVIICYRFLKLGWQHRVNTDAKDCGAGGAQQWLMEQDEGVSVTMCGCGQTSHDCLCPFF